MVIVDPWCDAMTNIDYCQDLHKELVVDSLSLGNHFIVMTNSNLSKFSANVIYNLQFLGLISVSTRNPTIHDLQIL